MKKIIGIIVAVVVVIAVIGSLNSGDEPKKETYDDNKTQEAQQKEETYGLNETAAFNNLKITAVELVQNSGKDFFTPEAGNVFVGVKFVIENVSNEEQTVSSLLLFDGYADDVKCDYSISAAAAFSGGTLDGDLAPGKKMEGWFALEVPENWQTVELEVKANWLSSQSAVFVFNK